MTRALLALSADEVTRAAMYLLMKNQGKSTRNRAEVEREWNRWHRSVQKAYRERIRKTLQAITWATHRVTNTTKESNG